MHICYFVSQVRALHFEIFKVSATKKYTCFRFDRETRKYVIVVLPIVYESEPTSTLPSCTTFEALLNLTFRFNHGLHNLHLRVH